MAAAAAVGETAITLHPPSPFSRCCNRDGERKRQQNDSTLAGGYSRRRVLGAGPVDAWVKEEMAHQREVGARLRTPPAHAHAHAHAHLPFCSAPSVLFGDSWAITGLFCSAGPGSSGASAAASPPRRSPPQIGWITTSCCGARASHAALGPGGVTVCSSIALIHPAQCAPLLIQLIHCRQAGEQPADGRGGVGAPGPRRRQLVHPPRTPNHTHTHSPLIF